MQSKWWWIAVGVVLLHCGGAVGQSIKNGEKLKVEVLKEEAPEEVAGPLRDVLAPEGIRVSREDGKPWIDLWLRKAIPATEEPAGPKGTILYPFLQPGEYLGAVRLHGSEYDYRDQEILSGTYTIRYGLQPVNGDHLGVSPYRDYFLLLPTEDDQQLVVKGEEDLNLESSFAAGSNHPAVFMLLPAPEAVTSKPSILIDEANQRTGLVIDLPIQPAGKEKTASVTTQLIIIGVGPH